MKVKLKHPSGPQRVRRTALEGKRNSYSDCITHPPGQHSDAPRMHTGPMVPTVGKREPKVDIQLPHYCGILLEKTFSSCLLGITAGIDHWRSDRDGERKRGLQ